MKKTATVLAFILLLSGRALLPGEEPPQERGPVKGRVLFSYTLHKVPRIASNQLALWIEDDQGGYVTTLFATRFMAKGGYKKRPDVCPEWIDTVLWEGLTNREMDALSSPTQKPGKIELTWDCTDRRGNPVAEGEYVYKLEGNIFWENRVVWSGKIRIGKDSFFSKGEPLFIPQKAKDMDKLIEDVTARFIPN